MVPEPGQMGSQTYDYEGEIDEDGKACGVGIARREGSASYKGTFCNNMIHGIGEYFFGTQLLCLYSSFWCRE